MREIQQISSKSRILSIILEYLNLLLLGIVFFSLKESTPQILGGTIVLIIIPPFLSFCSYWFKRFTIELNFISFIVFGILGWQYINYYEIKGGISHSLLLISFVFILSLIFVFMAYILIKPFHLTITLPAGDINKAFEKSIKFRYYYFAYNAICLAYVFGRVTPSGNEAPLLQKHVVSFVDMGILTMMISNLVSYINFRGLEKYVRYAYQKRRLNMTAVRKFTFYLLVLTFLAGIIVELLTRRNIILFFETYSFIFVSVMLLLKIYKREELLDDIRDTSELSIDQIKISFNFIIKFMIGFVLVDSICLISFALLL